MGLLIYLRCCEGCPPRSCRQSNSVVVLVGILRVIARQGNPSEIISDNAAQFKLSKSTIDVAWQKVIKDPSVQSYILNQGIK